MAMAAPGERLVCACGKHFQRARGLCAWCEARIVARYSAVVAGQKRPATSWRVHPTRQDTSPPIEKPAYVPAPARVHRSPDGVEFEVVWDGRGVTEAGAK